MVGQGVSISYGRSFIEIIVIHTVSVIIHTFVKWDGGFTKIGQVTEFTYAKVYYVIGLAITTTTLIIMHAIDSKTI